MLSPDLLKQCRAIMERTDREIATAQYAHEVKWFCDEVLSWVGNRRVSPAALRAGIDKIGERFVNN